MDPVWLEQHGFSKVVEVDDNTCFYERTVAPGMWLECKSDETGLVSFDLTCHSISRRDLDARKASLDVKLRQPDRLILLVLWCIENCLAKAAATAHNNQIVTRPITEANDDVADEAPGFTEGEYADEASFDYRRYIPDNIPHDKSHVLDIYVWGKALRNTLPAQLRVEKNFNAAILHGKKSGVDWSDCSSNPAIRRAVMQSPGFRDLFEHIVRSIATGKLRSIGINCRKGRHRSGTLAHLVKHCFFPRARLHMLEPRSKEQRKFVWE